MSIFKSDLHFPAKYYVDLLQKEKDKVLKLKEVLKQAHACATLKEDGTCGGCFVSEALLL